MAIEERNDALALGMKGPVERYEWAADRVVEVRDVDLVADVGCGMGFGTGALQQLAYPAVVIGFDFSREALDYARDHYPGPYVLCDIALQTFTGFDVVVCLETFSHLIDPRTWLKNLDSRGCIISAPMRPSSAEYPYRLHDLPPDEFRAMFAPRWEIVEEHVQGAGTQYLMIHAKRGALS